MKKVLYLLVMLVLVLAVLSACGEKKDPPAETDVLTPSPAEDFEYEIVEAGGLQMKGLYITKYIGSDEKVVIPGEIDGETVVGISYTREADGSEQGAYVGAFQNSSVQSVFIPASVGILGENAFSDCSHLTEVGFYGENSRLGTIGHAFENCTALETIDFSGTTVNLIGYKAFRGCTALKEIKFSEFVTYIDVNAFENCTALASIDLSGTKLDRIEAYTFFGCTALKEVKFSESVTLIRQNAFENCTALETIDLSGTKLESIESNAFLGCTALKEVKFSECIAETWENVFENCTSLKEITIPASVVLLGMDIFKLPNLEKITFLGNCPKAYRFFPNDVREEITIYYDPTTEGWNPWPWEDNCAHVSLTS